MEGNADRTDGIYSIGAVARMLGLTGANAASLGGSLSADRACSQHAAGSGSTAATR